MSRAVVRRHLVYEPENTDVDPAIAVCPNGTDMPKMRQGFMSSAHRTTNIFMEQAVQAILDFNDA